ncbi:MAG: BrnT family toxin [Candidatus Omnitrophica bacterium]|nr:BrnT family toxin [Candidatus Omnitrophota bacterium]
MSDIKFNWDKRKAILNKKKHGVSFEEAKTVFYDDYAIEFFDPDHSESEDRFIMLGMSFMVRVLIVCHCVREKGSIIRIISARKATKQEAQKYREEKS